MYVVVGLHYIISHDTVSISYNHKLCLLKTQYTFFLPLQVPRSEPDCMLSSLSSPQTKMAPLSLCSVADHL